MEINILNAHHSSILYMNCIQ